LKKERERENMPKSSCPSAGRPLAGSSNNEPTADEQGAAAASWLGLLDLGFLNVGRLWAEARIELLDCFRAYFAAPPDDQ
jgi:hypothetical protein